MSARARLVRGVAAWGLAASAALAPRSASAFGGVFTPASGGSFAVSHRVAIAVQQDGTVMWDQITWTSASAPRELAWVLPVRPGAKVELTSDAFFAALDSTTRAVVYSPPDFGPSASCALAGCSSDPAFGQGPSKLSVTQSAVTAPVESLVVQGADPKALPAWLGSHGFAIPEGALSAIAAYSAEGWDFAVYRLEPDCNATSSRVARVTTKGASSAVIPTRLAQAGTGYAVPMTLFTLAPTRLAPTGITNQTIDADGLLWKEHDGKSNYDELANNVITRGAMLTEFAGIPTLNAASPRLPSVYDLYPGLCGTATIPDVDLTRPSAPRACTSGPTGDAGADAGDAGDAGPDDGGDAGDLDAGDAGSDAGDLDAGDLDAGEIEGGAPDAGTIVPSITADPCASPDDLTVALRGGLTTLSAVVTRMRGQPPTTALTTRDLVLVPTSGLVSNQLQAIEYDPSSSTSARDKTTDHPNRSAACGTVRRRAYASWTAIALSLTALLAAWARRRLRP